MDGPKEEELIPDKLARVGVSGLCIASCLHMKFTCLLWTFKWLSIIARYTPVISHHFTVVASKTCLQFKFSTLAAGLWFFSGFSSFPSTPKITGISIVLKWPLIAVGRMLSCMEFGQFGWTSFKCSERVHVDGFCAQGHHYYTLDKHTGVGGLNLCQYCRIFYINRCIYVTGRWTSRTSHPLPQTITDVSKRQNTNPYICIWYL